MRKFIKIILGGFILSVTAAILGAGVCVWWSTQEFVKPTAFDAPIEVTISKGGNIAEELLYAGVLPSTQSMWVFKIAGKITGQDIKLKAGEYSIPAHSSIKDILNLLEDGKVILRQVTIPEGLTNWEIKQLLLANTELTKGAEFLILPEGSYLPETYSYQKGETAFDIMNHMHEAMTKTIDELWASRAPNLPFDTKEQALTLASIVEKETSVAEERARVAGVFINRLRQNIPLQTDPTVIYALTLGENQNKGYGPLGRRLLKKDLEAESPYNTYLHAGLPPTPIANAGRASIQATLHPEEHDFLYFVANGSGGHVFAKTLEEHNRNVTQWRKIRAEQ